MKKNRSKQLHTSLPLITHSMARPSPPMIHHVCSIYQSYYTIAVPVFK